MGIKFGKDNKDDVKYYMGIFIDLKCPADYAETLAKGHLGIGHLRPFDKDIKNLMLQGFPYATAKSMAEDEQAWR